MSPPTQPWGSHLQNSTPVMRNSGPALPQISGRSAPALPPRPGNTALSPYSGYNSTYGSYMPSGYGTGYGTGYGSSYGSYNSYSMPYRSSMYSSYGGYGNMYGMGAMGAMGSMGGYSTYDDTERRFIQYAEESSRNTFASVENVVRAFNSIAMMLDNTFFAMTSSFRAVLSVADNFGRLRTMFGQIWYTVNVFRFFSWAYRKLRSMMGLKVAKSASSAAWKEAAQSVDPNALPGAGATGSSSWPTLAFLGMLVSAPYIISKFIPKYEDKSNPDTWREPGIRAKAVFDFIGSSPQELTVHINDMIMLAPMHVQEEMQLKNTGWAFAIFNGKSGVVPLNYLVISKSTHSNTSTIVNNNNDVVVPKTHSNLKTHTKRVSFGENQIFENVDLDDYKVPDAGDSCSTKSGTSPNNAPDAENTTQIETS